MKVKELIELLQEYDEDRDVIVWEHFSGIYRVLECLGAVTFVSGNKSRKVVTLNNSEKSIYEAYGRKFLYVTGFEWQEDISNYLKENLLKIINEPTESILRDSVIGTSMIKTEITNDGLVNFKHIGPGGFELCGACYSLPGMCNCMDEEDKAVVDDRYSETLSVLGGKS